MRRGETAALKMRTEREMMELILGVAQRDERILAVYMNGSRTNPNSQGTSSRIMISYMWSGKFLLSEKIRSG